MSGPMFADDGQSRIVCSGSVTGATGVAPLVGGNKMRGIAASTGAPGQTIVRTGPGAYEIHLPAEDAVSEAQAQIILTPRGIILSNQSLHVVSWGTTGVITIASVLASSSGPIVPTDVDFNFIVVLLSPG